jgi:tRNA uridine 5-carboxymethylaminomethyl modification enzyme
MRYGYELGLIPSEAYDALRKKEEYVSILTGYVRQKSVPPSAVNPYLESIGSTPLSESEKLSQLVKRQDVKLSEVLGLEFFRRDSLPVEAASHKHAVEQVEIETKYEGYIVRQLDEIEKFEKFDSMEIPEGFDYGRVKSISTEAREKLTRVMPSSIGQASRISGVSPADVSVLMVYLHG